MAFSQAEHDYCAQAIQQGIRLDGRGPKDFRPIELELGLIAQASGSARLHLGSTDVIVGVKVEVGQPEATKPECGRLQVTVECSPTASPDYEGRGGDAWGLQLAAALESSLCPPGAQKGCGVPLESLNIISGKTCWVVYVDALVLNDDGNVLGALGMACWAALANTRIPHVELVAGEGDEEPELELDDDMDNAMQLDVSGIPVMVSVSQNLRLPPPSCMAGKAGIETSNSHMPLSPIKENNATQQGGGATGGHNCAADELPIDLVSPVAPHSSVDPPVLAAAESPTKDHDATQQYLVLGIGAACGHSCVADEHRPFAQVGSNALGGRSHVAQRQHLVTDACNDTVCGHSQGVYKQGPTTQAHTDAACGHSKAVHMQGPAAEARTYAVCGYSNAVHMQGPDTQSCSDAVSWRSKVTHKGSPDVQGPIEARAAVVCGYSNAVHMQGPDAQSCSDAVCGHGKVAYKDGPEVQGPKQAELRPSGVPQSSMQKKSPDKQRRQPAAAAAAAAAQGSPRTFSIQSHLTQVVECLSQVLSTPPVTRYSNCKGGGVETADCQVTPDSSIVTKGAFRTSELARLAVANPCLLRWIAGCRQTTSSDQLSTLSSLHGSLRRHLSARARSGGSMTHGLGHHARPADSGNQQGPSDKVSALNHEETICYDAVAGADVDSSPAVMEVVADVDSSPAAVMEVVADVDSSPAVMEVVADVDSSPAVMEVVADGDSSPSVMEVVADGDSSPAVRGVVADVDSNAVHMQGPAAQACSDSDAGQPAAAVAIAASQGSSRSFSIQSHVTQVVECLSQVLTYPPVMQNSYCTGGVAEAADCQVTPNSTVVTKGAFRTSELSRLAVSNPCLLRWIAGCRQTTSSDQLPTLSSLHGSVRRHLSARARSGGSMTHGLGHHARPADSRAQQGPSDKASALNHEEAICYDAVAVVADVDSSPSVREVVADVDSSPSVMEVVADGDNSPAVMEVVPDVDSSPAIMAVGDSSPSVMEVVADVDSSQQRLMKARQPAAAAAAAAHGSPRTFSIQSHMTQVVECLSQLLITPPVMQNSNCQVGGVEAADCQVTPNSTIVTKGAFRMSELARLAVANPCLLRWIAGCRQTTSSDQLPTLSSLHGSLRRHLSARARSGGSMMHGLGHHARPADSGAQQGASDKVSALNHEEAICYVGVAGVADVDSSPAVMEVVADVDRSPAVMEVVADGDSSPMALTSSVGEELRHCWGLGHPFKQPRIGSAGRIGERDSSTTAKGQSSPSGRASACCVCEESSHSWGRGHPFKYQRTDSAGGGDQSKKSRAAGHGVSEKTVSARGCLREHQLGDAAGREANEKSNPVPGPLHKHQLMRSEGGNVQSMEGNNAGRGASEKSIHNPGRPLKKRVQRYRPLADFYEPGELGTLSARLQEQHYGPLADFYEP
eukprot:gene7953-1169_t